MFWSSTHDILRILILAPIIYVALIAILRLTGKRMLSKMTAFDFVVTIALGSVLATVILSKNVALVEGLLALGTLIGLQYLIAWSATRWKAFNRLIESEPALLYFRGRFLAHSLRKENVTEEAIRSAMRAAGCGSESEIEAVVMEPNGSLSIVKAPPAGGDLLRLTPNGSE